MAEAKSTHSGDEWSDDDVRELEHLAAGNTPIGVMSVRLGRSERAIRTKAEAAGIPLAPANRPPYGAAS
jgi:hypothetical protein